MADNKSFAELFQEKAEATKLVPGSVINAEVVEVGSDYVVLNAGLKSEVRVPKDEFRDIENEVDIKVGDTVEVVLESVENGYGKTVLSRAKAARVKTLLQLEEAVASNESVWGTITERVRGGFTVEVGKVKAFLPASLLDTKQVRDPTPYITGKPEKFKVIKIDKQNNNNVVLSRKAVVEEESGAERAAILGTLKEGDEVKGVVKNITDYGVFIDLGGVDGLLHITDMSWKRIRHPSEILSVGQEVNVVILKFDPEKKRVSLGLKQLGEDPWSGIDRRYPVGSRLFGKVTNIADYGCFVEIEPGIEGLVHMSEMDWTNKNVNPAKMVSVGQEVEVMVLEIDASRRRISLGMKQCHPNPWQEFAAQHHKDEKITGKIKSITDFGIFLGLTGNIDGLVHLSDLSWTEPGEKAIRNYKKGQDVEAVILAIDPERERISLGIKQLESDIYGEYLAKNPKGTVVTGKVTEVTAKSALVDLGGDIVGKIRVSEASKDNIKEISEFLAVGDEIEAKVIGFDKKSRNINLSIKELQDEIQSEAAPSASLGDLLKEQMEKED
jgi:small subunit ribosomal protein S1